MGTDGIVTAALAVQDPEIGIPDDRVSELGILVVEAARAIATIMPSGYQL